MEMAIPQGSPKLWLNSQNKVGIELRRATVLRIRWLIHGFHPGPQSDFRKFYVSSSPPFIPDSRISRVRLATQHFTYEAFSKVTRLNPSSPRNTPCHFTFTSQLGKAPIVSSLGFYPSSYFGVLAGLVSRVPLPYLGVTLAGMVFTTI